jgi:hypothetical protein
VIFGLFSPVFVCLENMQKFFAFGPLLTEEEDDLAHIVLEENMFISISV